MNDDTADAPDGLLDAFWEYERALMTNDLEALDRLFAPGPDTLRGDAQGLLIGHEQIAKFRGGRGGAPARTIVDLHVRAIDDNNALVIAITSPTTGGRGQQTQLWRRDAGGWVVTAAHVASPAPAITAAVWRVLGSPLLAGAAEGPLSGLGVAVKDLFEVRGFGVGGGVPAYLEDAEPAASSAPALQMLLDAGAFVQGIAHTDEFAYSIAGKNVHYGTPPNGVVRGGMPGGSSSGPASAVSLGQAAIGLGTDTAGSIRVPASYQGLWGLRTTHDAVSREQLLPLAPSFDTVGWLTRDAATLAAAASASLDNQVSVEGRYAVAPALTALATPSVREAFAAATAALDTEEVDLGEPDELFLTFRTIQAAEAWRSHGGWVSAHPGALGDDIAARFEYASTISGDAEAAARLAREYLVAKILRRLDGRILLLPSASSIPPPVTADGAAIEEVRGATLRMTCLAGLAGLPALSVPLLRVKGAPVGLCLVGPANTDLALIDHAAELSAQLSAQLSAEPEASRESGKIPPLRAF